MEDRPSERAHDKRQHRGEERSPCRPKRALRNGQNRCELQRQQEAPSKKAGTRKVNGSSAEAEQTPCAGGSILCSNGSGQHRESSFGVRHLGKATSCVLKAASRGTPAKAAGDSKNSREPILLLNGMVGLDSGCVTNGYPAKRVPDTDSSSSESGYATPEGGTTVLKGSVLSSRRDSVPSSPEMGKKPSGVRPDDTRAPSGPAAATGEPQRKNSDAKVASRRFEERPGRSKTATPVPLKEDTWTLFRPPPVFPVDNSSAKIVPKISYASKVKENLNKMAPEEGLIKSPPPPVVSAATTRLSHVPMSAVKTIPSASFSNGPLCTDGTSFPPSPSLPAVPVATSFTGADNAAVPPSNSSGTTLPLAATGEHRKAALFVCPLTLSSMQPVLPSARLPDAPAPEAGRKALVDIFHNEWGLSFINEPNAGRQGVPGGLATVTFQAGNEPSAPALEPPVVSPACQQDRRTSGPPPSGALRVCAPTALVSDSGTWTQPLGSDSHEAEVGDTTPLVSPSTECRSVSPATPPEPEADRKGVFDLKAAVIYHTKGRSLCVGTLNLKGGSGFSQQLRAGFEIRNKQIFGAFSCFS
ncbi:nuclear fragile X mental retardation-interacting protein 2-like isoform X1 [Scleropages formosus]|uniref:Nuclear fragile X mental retardation-interacting protein 2-like n=1 Tax=Scleropages formosus TaxID=113540 RepID=A0A8C9V8Z5_SCLFO|nr:nuclear fragile X mental retardation-interacting protein 2-like isoform X1 [Scleropages formosus]